MNYILGGCALAIGLMVSNAPALAQNSGIQIVPQPPRIPNLQLSPLGLPQPRMADEPRVRVVLRCQTAKGHCAFISDVKAPAGTRCSCEGEPGTTF